MSGQWIEVFAGLKNPGMRQVLGVILLEESQRLGSDRATAKNLERWQKIGLVTEDAGRWVINEQLLTQALAAQAKPSTDRQGPERFFTGPKLTTLPAKAGERLEVLKYLRNAVIGAGQELSESQLNERLGVFHPDVALLRRYMVDHGLLHRTGDGSVYTLPSP